MTNLKDINELRNKATLYFNALAEKLKDTHEVVESCNGDFSKYLIPKGSINELTYYSKPVNSYRISDHWNWYSSTKKCKDETYVQCNNIALPPARKRTELGKATNPRKAICVAYYGDDGVYRTIYGEKFSWKTKKYYWLESSFWFRFLEKTESKNFE